MSTLLRNARVVPLPPPTPDAPVTPGFAPPSSTTPAGDTDRPVDLRLTDGRVDAVGRPGEALEARPWDDVVDVQGRWVLPGLWDAHTHMGQWALARQRLDVADAGSVEEATALVVERLRGRAVEPDEFLVAVGFRDGLWARPPVAADLDRAIANAGLPETAVVVVCGDMHSAWLSTAALRRVGAPTSDGVLREEDWFPLMNGLHEASATTLDRWVTEASAVAAERGVVGVVDLELADDLALWQRRIAAGATSLRVAAAVWRDHLDHAVARGLATGDVLPGTGGLLSMGPFKVISDGSLNTRTAFCHDPYPGVEGPRAHGTLNVGPDELEPLMAHAHRHGIRSAIHAIGDRANALALDAFERTGARGSVEHAQMLTDDDVPRFARLGVVASVQPEHAMDDRDVIDRYWAGRAGRTFPLARLHAAGATLTLGSDAPVSPLDPWEAVSAAVDRTRGDREPWRPQDGLPADVALASSVRSRVAVGQPADLVLLDADPLTARGGALRRMPVAGTLVAGRWTHRGL